MASIDPSDGSEDVADFLRRIRELGEQRDKEDAERTRKLEEEIMEGRRQREVRRAERARSLSPEKQSPVNTPQSLRAARAAPRPDPRPEHNPSSPLSLSASPLPLLSTGTISRSESDVPERITLSDRSPERLGPKSELPETERLRPGSPSKASPGSAVGLARSGTLSWQQRPASLRGPRSRPLSFADNAPAPVTPTSRSATGSTDILDPSRDEIAQSLGSKDPSWFRQTADRGARSAAYVQDHEETENARSWVSEKRKLPGMSRDSNANFESDHIALLGSTISSSPSLVGSVSGSLLSSSRLSGAILKPDSSFSESTLPTPTHASHRFTPPGTVHETVINDTEMSFEPPTTTTASLPGQISPKRIERPASPTKGMGGFVQSAMLKRSESISKRWSAQPTTGLSRQTSNATTRGFQDGQTALQWSSSMPRLRHSQSVSSRESSMEPGSRPSSSHSTVTVIPKFGESVENAHFAKPLLPYHSRSQSAVAGAREVASGEQTSPPSPSKRWSPVKSSWLESALSKPDPPIPKVATTQPGWMSDLNKNKQQRNSREVGEEDEIKTVAAPGLKPHEIAPPLIGSMPPQNSTPIAPPTKPKPPVIPQKASIPNLRQAVPERNVDSDSQLKNSEMITCLPNPSPNHKTKPETPPKKDFRSNLKHRHTPSEEKAREEFEFQNVFGKLKRAQPEKHIASDELKNNILRGKLSLSETDGPQKSLRKDELKESLIEQKTAMKVKASEVSTSDHKNNLSSSRELPVPEAIAKKQALGRNDVSRNALDSQSEPSTTDSKRAEALARTNGVDSTHAGDDHGESNTADAPPIASGKLASRFTPALASILAKGPPAASRSTGPAAARTANGIVADRNKPAEGMAEASASCQLQHMTKDRARGPKRRAPGTKSNIAEIESHSSRQAQANPVVQITSKPKPKQQSPVSSRNVTLSKATPLKIQSSKPQTPPKSPQLAPKPDGVAATDKACEGQDSRASNSSVFPAKPSVPSKSSSLRSSRSSNPEEPKSASTSDMPGRVVGSIASTWSAFSVKGATALWGRQATTQSSDSTRAKPPITLPTREEEKAAMEGAGLVRTQEATGNPVGLGLDLGLDVSERTNRVKSADAHATMPSHRWPMSPPASASTTPKPVIDPTAKTPRQASTSSHTPATSPVPPISVAGRLFGDFFDETPISRGKLELDIRAILNSNPAGSGKIKTLRKQIVEITGDGKTSPLPHDQEHVLYSTSMYLCTHVFGNAKGTRTTEVYLWIGTLIPEPLFEEVQPFARKLSKDNRGELLIFRQGKEPANFFQALGGIVIIRNASSKDASKSYMLCGRQHLAHIAFDEIELSLSNLCSGFPYIVVSQAGKLFLWKGAGCNAEELGCARLISMDLGPTGEVTEIDEARETPDFLAIFSASSTGKAAVAPSAAEHWKIKPKHDNYRARLFQIEYFPPSATAPTTTATAPLPKPSFSKPLWQLIRRPSQPEDSPPTSTPHITEIVPFCQADLQPENIYVLDAYFEIYIILGPLATSKIHAQAFASVALPFAQAYAPLAASTEDRPFVPPGVVVLEGVPRDMKSAFRTWDDAAVPTGALMAGRLKEGRGLRVVSLGDALAAVGAGA